MDSTLSIAINGEEVELNAFVTRLIGNLVDAIIASLNTKGEAGNIVITRVNRAGRG
jgi:hypothetical protein